MSPRSPRLRRGRLAIAGFVAGLLGVGGLAGCTTSGSGSGAGGGPSAGGASSASAPPGPLSSAGGVVVTGAPRDVVTGLQSPWSMLRVTPDITLVSERDSGVIERVRTTGSSSGSTSGSLIEVGTVPGVVHDGEGGLLGLAFLPAASASSGAGALGWLYAYETTASDNRIVRMTLTLDGDEVSLGRARVVLRGLESSSRHNGGRIAFGPDGMLYATVGDAGVTSRAQEVSSLNGKILRMTPTGGVPAGNPFPDSLVWSLGHRNPQGLAWDASGQLWAAEFGQDTWDEFNKITAGENYGWPVVEGEAHDPRFVDPVAQWSTDDASPSGLAYVGGTFFLAGLGGERLWTIRVDAAGVATSTSSYVGGYGRLRDVAQGPDDSLWMLTDNTDGRGDPRPGDDRILQVALSASSPSPGGG